MMQSPLEGVFDEADNRYLKPEELQAIGQYVASISERTSAYRALRDHEIDLVQRAADELQLELPSIETTALERTIKYGMLILRQCAMGMLLNDAEYVQKRLLNWLKDAISLHQDQKINAVFFRLIQQQLRFSLNAQQVALLEPFLSLVDPVIPAQEEEMLTVAGIF
ncbi:hypothetical protein Q2T42_28375 [Leptolyngbya boryana CZ1]|uniref:Phycobilisome protein n=1 Tax=Leptolyngbya boryana CZ1 TaxID=3060204 RepID=A0AA96WWZ7_LEPBY|nr:hypothetical protein [Leptolyngbya boryana]WNZ45709.1 hypothetical protein Q2T42_28375 [Leptolyngbya boryana CZ1]